MCTCIQKCQHDEIEEHHSPMRRRTERVDSTPDEPATPTLSRDRHGLSSTLTPGRDTSYVLSATLHGLPMTNINSIIPPVVNRNLFPNILPTTNPFMRKEDLPLITTPIFSPFCPVPFNDLCSPFPMIPPIISTLGNGLSSLISQIPVPQRPFPTLSRPDQQPIVPISRCASDVASAVYDTMSVPTTSMAGSPTCSITTNSNLNS